MDELNGLDRFDLAAHGDLQERESWPLLSGRFPSYELLWRRLIVPMTSRIDRGVDPSSDRWIRFRPDVPERYEQLSMAHYSVFYFLGRALERISVEQTAFEHPEDVLFLMDSVGDNFKSFLKAMNAIGNDCGNKNKVFEPKFINQFPKAYPPFAEISAYRDVLLHNPVLGRGVEEGKVYLPKWSDNKSKSPLDQVKTSWIKAGKLLWEDRVSTTDLLERLVAEVCCLLENSWKQALEAVKQPLFEEKMVRVLQLRKHFPLTAPGQPRDAAPTASGDIWPLGSNTNIPIRRS
jgi:hypothetical protein